MHLRFDCYGAYVYKENRHPQEVMKSLGISYQHSTPQSMADQWWFWNCKDIPQELPKYLSQLNTDPKNHIGNGLSKEDAEKISQCAN